VKAVGRLTLQIRVGGHITRVNFLQLVADRQAPAAARGHVREECADHGVSQRVTDTAVLLTSEVVTNAVLHGRDTVTLGTLTLGADAHDASVRVEVIDGSEVVPRMRAVDAERESGRGMTIVNALAAEWGVTLTTPGKTVWFEVAEPVAADGVGEGR
jgi:anti-sigma regulatory factor (Ser/Thr protein kinase)